MAQHLVRVEIVAPDDDGVLRRSVTETEYLEAPNRNAVLDVFESALRGAGYMCPFDGLSVNDEDGQK